MTMIPTILVLGVPTFDSTGLFVIRRLIERKNSVHVIVPSQEQFLNQFCSVTIDDPSANDTGIEVTRDSIQQGKNLLRITEIPSFLTDETTAAEDATVLKAHIESMGTVIVVPCLDKLLSSSSSTSSGQPSLCHRHPTRRVLIDTVQSLVRIMAATRTPPTRKLIILSSATAVTLPTDTDRLRCGRIEKLRWRYLQTHLPNYSDHKHANAYLHSLVGTGNMQWCVLRAGIVRDNNIKKHAGRFRKHSQPDVGYKLDDQLPVLSDWKQTCPKACQITRANVVNCLEDLISRDNVWNRYKLRMPVLLNNDPNNACAQIKEEEGPKM